VGLAKMCKRLDVPTPGWGYWQQLAAGMDPVREELPDRGSGTPTEVQIKKHAPKVKAPPVAVPSVPVADTLAGADSLVREIQQRLRGPLETEHGMKVIFGGGHAVVKVSPQTENRTLRILNALFKALRARGHDIRLRTTREYGREFAVLETAIGGETAIDFWLTEHVKRTERVLTKEEKARKERFHFLLAGRYDYAPSGRLILEINAPSGYELRRRWADGKKQRIEDVLGEVVVGLEAAALAWRDDQERRERERHDEERRERQRQAANRRAAHRKALEEDLVQMANAWAQAQLVRSFLVAVQDKVREAERSDGFAAWLSWAMDHVEEVDPLADPQAIAKSLRVPRDKRYEDENEDSDW